MDHEKPLEGADRFLITRITTDNPDTFEAFPREMKDTISEVHRDIGMGTVGTYGIDLDPEQEQKVRGASNLIQLTRLSDYALGYAREYQHERYSLEEEYETITAMVAGVQIPDVTKDPLPPEDAPDSYVDGRMTVEGVSPEVRTHRYYKIGPILDQQREGACTGFGVQAFLNAAPIMSKGTNDDARRLYYRARQIDEWPGEAYDGSSISAATRAAVELGLVGSWGYAQNRDECIRWKLGGFGGIIYGMNWYEGMYVPDAQGFLRPTGRLVGGHCLFDRGISKWMNDRPQQSWGYDFGERGLAWFLDADMRAMWARGEVEAIMATQIAR